MEHTPTLWTATFEKTILAQDGGFIAVLERGGWYLNNAQANAKRIVQCVNACAPFKDPQISIPKLLFEVEALQDRVKELEDAAIIATVINK